MTALELQRLLKAKVPHRLVLIHFEMYITYFVRLNPEFGRLLFARLESS